MKNDFDNLTGLAYVYAAMHIKKYGWVCKSCKRFYGDKILSEHRARRCCCNDQEIHLIDNLDRLFYKILTWNKRYTSVSHFF